jgi:hypothetical protein
MSKYTVADSKTFLKLAQKAQVRDFLWLKRRIDPEGTHVVDLALLHNDVEVRAFWLVKLDGIDEPFGVNFAVPLADFNKLPQVESNDFVRAEDK